ncbi:amidase domain-containing protein [Actinomadura barringtoniae]|uniref:Amidase domain-containing protein n=1 Tax=Actinomadura barringtoniae TaxID=1427535 RepID=A0A939PA17_9ACTN|nr:amidase domain-containing protein [Actinomadura barringtoniae]MBO2448715.1 amidase domain-containing protein [Actinomadura barringtoniae]
MAIALILAVSMLAVPSGLGWSRVNADTQSAPGQFFPTRGRALDNVEIAAGGTSIVRVIGIGAVPWSGVGSVALNVAAKGSSGTGSVVVYPSDGTDTAATAMSYRTEVYAANLVTVKVGADGNIKVANKGAGPVKVTLDLHGYTLTEAASTAGSTFVPLAPARILNAVSIPAFGNYELVPLDKGGVPASGVESLAYTLRAKGTAGGTLRTYAAGDVFPGDATIDYASGLSLQNFAITKLGTDGKINIHNMGAAAVTVWVDVAGYFTKTKADGPTLRPIQPTRLTTNASIAAGTSYTLAPLGKGGVPATGVDAISVSVTAKSTIAGALTAYPSGTTAPTTHTVGFDANVQATGSTIAKLGADGKVLIRNTGTAATTVSIDAYGYFRTGVALTELTATPFDHQWAEGVRVNDATPTLSATATSVGGPITYTFEVAPALSNTPVASGTTTAVASGQPATWTVPAGRLTNPGALRFRVKADDGVDALWSAWKWLAVDAPLVPTTLSTDLNDPEAPVLSGTVFRPSNGPVTGRFYLFDSDGKQMGASPFGQGTAQGGQRVTLRVPDDLVQPGHTYKWQMDACVGSACTPKTALTTFTTPAATPPPQTRSLTLGSDKISVRTAKVGGQACDGSPCPLTDDTTVRVGGTADNAWLSQVKVNLTTLPAGARVTSVTLGLGSASCASTCPDTVTLSAHDLAENLSAQPTGAEASEKVLSDAVAQTSSLSNVELNLGDMGVLWQNARQNDGVFLRAQAQDLPDITIPASSVSATVTYVPAGPPSTVQGLVGTGGDGAAQITWAPPNDPGAASTVTNDEDATEVSPITDYEIQVLGSGGQVVRTVTATDTQVTIPDLTNGTTYRFQVRARSSQGTGTWETTTPVTPQTIPLGADKFVTAVKEYIDSQNGIMERKFNTADAAADASTQGTTFHDLLTTQADPLLQVRDNAAAAQAAQVSTTATYPDIFVGYSAETSTITVSVRVEGQTVYANDFGTSTEERTTNTFGRENTFSFSLPSATSAAAARTLQAAAPQEPTLTTVGAEDAPAPTEINAYTPEQAQELPKPPEDAFLDPSGDPPGTQKTATARAASGVDGEGIAAWAVRNAPKVKQEYSENCTNFVSKAINRGGGARKYLGWYRSRGAWWENAPRDSWTWAGAENNMQHFTMAKFSGNTRGTWEPHWSWISRGDTIYFRRTKGGGITHTATVSKKTKNSVYGVYMVQHNRVNHKAHYDTYKPLWWVYSEYKGGVGFVWVRR